MSHRSIRKQGRESGGDPRRLGALIDHWVLGLEAEPPDTISANDDAHRPSAAAEERSAQEAPAAPAAGRSVVEQVRSGEMSLPAVAWAALFYARLRVGPRVDEWLARWLAQPHGRPGAATLQADLASWLDEQGHADVVSDLSRLAGPAASPPPPAAEGSAEP